jgi:hypothetical protein
MEIMKSSQVKMLEMKISTNQIKTKVDSIISKQDQTDERISEMGDETEE